LKTCNNFNRCNHIYPKIFVLLYQLSVKLASCKLPGPQACMGLVISGAGTGGWWSILWGFWGGAAEGWKSFAPALFRPAKGAPDAGIAAIQYLPAS